MVYNHTPKDEILAVNLDNHIRDYQPKTWEEQIVERYIPPPIMVQDVKKLRRFHSEGRLKEKLNNPEESGLKSIVFQDEEAEVVKEAIIDFFEKVYGE